MKIPRSLVLPCCLVLLAMGACDDNGTTEPDDGNPPPPQYTYDLVDAFPNLSFSMPVDIRSAGDGSNRLFVVEQDGVIRVFENVDSVSTASVFLDISSKVASGGELGLLGLAFHPDYASNGYFFMYYTTGNPGSRESILSRFTVSGDPDVANAASEDTLLQFPKPYPTYDNHNGGGMCFDTDGYLYLGLGDGGNGGDPDGYAQDLTALYGKILRLDVDQNVNTPPYYGIPPDNPFAGGGKGRLEEIFAYGFRNPWRISWDAVDGTLWVGDVGQGNYEEIDHVTNGGNYGWDCREGAHDYGSSSPACATAIGLIDPIFEYTHSEGRSITGGYVYRGPTLTSLSGRYLYADYVSGILWALGSTQPWESETLKDTGLNLSTFGVAPDGELLVAAHSGGGGQTKIYRITQTEVQN